MDDKQLLSLFTDTVRAHSVYMNLHLAELDLSVGQGGVLTALGQFGAMNQNELAQFRRVTPATISNMLDRMERDGLVVRETQSGAGRIKLVRLTEEGQNRFEQLDELMSSEPGIVFSGLTEEEKERAADIFRALMENVNNAADALAR